jgi:hypothetical protein
MEKKETPSEQIRLTIGKNIYDVKLPDTGTLIDLEQAKSRIIPPRSNTDGSLWAYNLAIAIETFRLLIPKLEEDMNVKSFDRLTLVESHTGELKEKPKWITKLSNKQKASSVLFNI